VLCLYTDGEGALYAGRAQRAVTVTAASPHGYGA
jgi:hypothetical protein